MFMSWTLEYVLRTIRVHGILPSTENEALNVDDYGADQQSSDRPVERVPKPRLGKKKP
jgi:hypothetical protein